MRQDTRLCVCLVIFVLTLPAQTAPESNFPSVQISSAPTFGSVSANISGRVLNVAPSNTSVAVLIFIPGLGTFSKPFCSPSTLTPLNPDGTFSVQTVSGGVDSTATQIAVIAVPSTTSVPCYGSDSNNPPFPGVPSALLSQALATAIVYRPRPTGREHPFLTI
jgi:hypothetical protein